MPNPEDAFAPNAREGVNTPTVEFLRRYANCMAAMEEAREDLRALGKEADAAGLNPRALKRAVRLIADDTGKRRLREQSELVDLLGYMRDAGEPLEIE